MPRRVLCIESEDALRERLRGLLEGEGFAVDLAATGLEGITRALTLPPDLVLADVHLPDIEGAELTARLKRERSLAGVPFVALGASREDHDVALAAGADGFVERGQDGALAGEVRAVLAGKRETLPAEGEREQLRALSGSMAAHLETAVAGAQRATQQVEEMGRLRRAFIHNLAHELSTPLTPLSGYLRILASGKLGALTAQQQRVVETMVLSVARLARVVDNLADFASLEAGEGPLLRNEVEPDRLADEVVKELEPAIRDARLHVTVTHAGGTPVLVDARKLRQAVANLVQNAVKFSPHGGEVLVEVARAADRVRFVVYDQGPGVAPGEAERIFEPLFHAATRGEAARLPGSGLGLPVARRIAEAHGGRVWVESPPRTQPAAQPRHFTGSKFVLELPARPVEGARTAGAEPAAAPV
jgi:signal transduction histidine kinase